MKKLTTIILLMMCSTLHAQREVFLASSPASNQLKTDNFYFEPDTTFYIFLAFGQSNMVGDAKPEDCDYQSVSPRFRMMPAIDQPATTGNNRGGLRKKYKWYRATPPLNRVNAGLSPCDYFGRTMVERLPENIKVGIINVAVGGCRIEHFFKEYDPRELARSGWPTWFVNCMAEYDSIQYIRLLDCALRAQHVGVIKGILLHQGEANRNDPLWCMKVKHVYDDLLHDLGLNARDVPLLAGQVVGEEQHGKSAIANKNVNALPKTIPTAHVISSVGCEADPDDTHHFSAEGYRTFGRRYADVMLDLMGVEH